MPTDPRYSGFTIPTTDADGYSDLVQFNYLHLVALNIPAMEAGTTEIWVEESPDNDTDNCVPVYYDGSRVAIDVQSAAWREQLDPGKFSGLRWVRLQATDGTNGVQQSTAARSIGVSCRDYK